MLFSSQLWHCESWQCVHMLKGHQECVRSCRFSWDSRRVATGDDNGEIRVSLQWLTPFNQHFCKDETSHSCFKLATSGCRHAEWYNSSSMRRNNGWKPSNLPQNSIGKPQLHRSAVIAEITPYLSSLIWIKCLLMCHDCCCA